MTRRKAGLIFMLIFAFLILFVGPIVYVVTLKARHVDGPVVGRYREL